MSETGYGLKIQNRVSLCEIDLNEVGGSGSACGKSRRRGPAVQSEHQKRVWGNGSRETGMLAVVCHQDFNAEEGRRARILSMPCRIYKYLGYGDIEQPEDALRA